MEDSIHILHEDTQRISHTKWHHKIFIVPIPCSKCSLRNILRLHPYLVISES